MPRARRPTDGTASSASPASVDPGERAVRFFNNLTHTGDYSGRPFDLRPWQAEPLRRLFGTLRPDGTRQYRKTFWALPRKQGKTEVVAGGGLYLLLGQGRKNQRIYTASGDTKQAGLIFDASVEMIRNDPVLAAHTVIYEGYKRIEFPAGNSKLEVLSSVPKSKHGLGPTGVLIDEYHVVNEELVNVLTTGFGARLDPLTWMITTAGHDRTSLCFDEWQYALKVRDGIVEDPTYLPVIFAADPSDDWTDEATWRKAMPALGDFCSIEFIREECKKAKERPRYENTFKQLYLNQWTEQATRWLSMEKWAACRPRASEDSLRNRACYAGLDLGVTGDMSALVLGFPDGRNGFDLLCRFWVPEHGKWRSEERNRSLYQLWHKQGFLEFTDGETQDHNRIIEAIVSLNERHPIRQLFADRAYAELVLSILFNAHDIPTKGITQGPVALNEAMVRLESLVIDGALAHGDNPVLSYNAANADLRRNATGLMYLDKSSSTNRIDGLAATVNMLAAAIAQGGGDDAGPSVYESRGMVWL